MKIALLLVALLGFAGCGDDKAAPDVPGAPDAGGTGGPDAGGVPGVTFEDFVIDLVENKTADNTPPVAIDFGSTDSQTADEFASLFH